MSRGWRRRSTGSRRSTRATAAHRWNSSTSPPSAPPTSASTPRPSHAPARRPAGPRADDARPAGTDPVPAGRVSFTALSVGRSFLGRIAQLLRVMLARLARRLGGRMHGVLGHLLAVLDRLGGEVA